MTSTSTPAFTPSCTTPAMRRDMVTLSPVPTADDTWPTTLRALTTGTSTLALHTDTNGKVKA